MGEAFAWIGRIVEWIGQWIPRWLVCPPTTGFVKYEGFFLPGRLRRFKSPMRITVLGPGLHWYWPATTQIDSYPVVIQQDNLPSQTIETLDHVTITVGGVLTYRVSDLGKLLPNCHNAIKLLQVITLAAIHTVICRMSHEALREEQRRGTLNTKLRNEVKRRTAEFGVEVEDCMLTDLVRSRAIRLIQSSQSDTE